MAFTDSRSMAQSIPSRRIVRSLCLVLGALSLVLLISHPAVSSSRPFQLTPSALDTVSPIKLPTHSAIHDQESSFVRSEQDALIPASSLSGKGKSALPARIGKVTSLFYDKATPLTKAYEDALLSHRQHNDLWHYPHFVLRHDLLGMWSKLAYINSLLVQELAKPATERLDWLFWHDADVILMNHQIPLETFLPPADRFSHVDYVVTNDLNGLNDGLMFLRVSQWSLRFMTAALAFETYKPEVSLRYHGQSAQEMLSRRDEWKNKTVHVPQRWFNAYHPYGSDDSVPAEWGWVNGFHRPGDMAVHLPGSAESRRALIDIWINRRRDEPEKYIVPLDKTNLTQEVERFWERDAAHEEENQVIYWRRFHVIWDAGGAVDRARDEALESYTAEAKVEGDDAETIKRKIEAIRTDFKQKKIEAMRKQYNDRTEGKETDDTREV